MNYIKLKLFRFVSIFMYFLFSFIATSKEKNIIKECKNYSFATTSDYHLWQLLFLFKKINKKNFSGNFVECGTWKGIYLVFFQKLIELYKFMDLILLKDFLNLQRVKISLLMVNRCLNVIEFLN